MIVASRWEKLRCLAVLDADGKRRHWPDEASARAELSDEAPHGCFDFFEVEPIELEAYWTALDRADWYWSMADDGAAYSRGAAEIGKLECQALWSPEHAAMFSAFERHYDAPVATRDQVAPKPARSCLDPRP